jgi:hypothetical protein
MTVERRYSKATGMRKPSCSVVCGTFFSIIFAQPTVANPQACRDAIDSYKSAISDVSTALRTYASCVSDSQGHDDCSSEFSSLRSAQDDFESAVSEYQSECP